MPGGVFKLEALIVRNDQAVELCVDFDHRGDRCDQKHPPQDPGLLCELLFQGGDCAVAKPLISVLPPFPTLAQFGVVRTAIQPRAIDHVPRSGVAPAIAVLSGRSREWVSLPQRAG